MSMTQTMSPEALRTAARSAKATTAQQVEYMSAGIGRSIQRNAGGTRVELLQSSGRTFRVWAWGMLQGEYTTAAAAVKAYRSALRAARQGA